MPAGYGDPADGLLMEVLLATELHRFRGRGEQNLEIGGRVFVFMARRGLADRIATREENIMIMSAWIE